MLVRRTLLAASVVGLSLFGASSSPKPAMAASGPPRLVARCYAQDLSVGASYEQFEAQATKWIGTCVAANREKKLVEGNASLRAVWNDVKHLSGTGKAVHVTTDFGWKDLGGSWGVNSVTFKTDVKAPAAPPPSPSQSSSSSSSPSPAKPLPPILHPDEKLPANLDGELRMALVRVRAAIDEDGGRVIPKAQADRLRCQIGKLADPKTDDRQISWMGACGVIIDTRSASQCQSSIDLRIKGEVKSVGDLDRQELPFVHHLRPEIVNASRRLYGGASNADVARFLVAIDSDMSRSVHGLLRMSERSQGFLALPHYLAINDWVAKEQRDSSSVMSCR